MNYDVSTVKIGDSELEVKHRWDSGDPSVGIWPGDEILSVKIYDTPQTKVWREKFKDFKEGGEWEHYTLEIILSTVTWSYEFDREELSVLFIDDFTNNVIETIKIDKSVKEAKETVIEFIKGFKRTISEFKEAIEKIYDFVTTEVNEIELIEYCDLDQIEQLLKDQED